MMTTFELVRAKAEAAHKAACALGVVSAAVKTRRCWLWRMRFLQNGFYY